MLTPTLRVRTRLLYCHVYHVDRDTHHFARYEGSATAGGDVLAHRIPN